MQDKNKVIREMTETMSWDSIIKRKENIGFCLSFP
ncbi:MAG: hypothetical protein MPEBLZ_03858 [Candidatus Methanoperedens nitroreducens]|uniref:Uncharacterized protein n=1 Tax=Candidatus Methanoperedens nitratireducens TaxID=1392998 RepID=A0A0P8A506_9EURY|nr:MAG: hypothetical protein MPEBLZ_03858 [Candidatus Methanoperedens sp. BLZ1]